MENEHSFSPHMRAMKPRQDRQSLYMRYTMDSAPAPVSGSQHCVWCSGHRCAACASHGTLSLLCLGAERQPQTLLDVLEFVPCSGEFTCACGQPLVLWISTDAFMLHFCAWLGQGTGALPTMLFMLCRLWCGPQLSHFQLCCVCLSNFGIRGFGVWLVQVKDNDR